MPQTLAVALLTLSLLAPGLTGAEDRLAGAVRIAEFAFEPATLRVKQGTVVQWVNEDDEPHTVTSDAGAFKSPALDKGKSYTFTFAQKGRFAYHCAIHPQMTGSVVVE